MNHKCTLYIILAMLMTPLLASHSIAGSERMIMSMTDQRMVSEDLVHIRFAAADGSALESAAIKQLSIREQNCDSGRLLAMPDGYKIGYTREAKLVGIYLPPSSWKNRTLCFSFPGVGKAEQHFDSEVSTTRYFHLTIKD